MKDMINKVFGNLTVIEYIGTRGNGNKWYRCLCSCGKLHDVAGYKLRSGHTKSCGCKKSHRRDISGQRFGRLVAISTEVRNGTTYWKCVCDCGNIHTTRLNNLTRGETKSCGCLDKDVKKASIHARMGFVDGTSLVAISEDRKINKNNTSGVRGVTFDSKRGVWKAQIFYKGKAYYLGRYLNIEDAIQARKIAEEKYYINKRKKESLKI